MNNYEVILRLLLAIFIGGLIGYERALNNRPAGFRTHILVCVGAAMVSIIQMYSVNEILDIVTKNPELASEFKVDIGRLSAQVITGVGFLGAGTIIQEKGSVKGLTTAASLWGVSCLGLAIGYGYYFLSIASAIAIFMVLVFLKKFEDKFMEKSKYKLRIEYNDEQFFRTEMKKYFRKKGIYIKDIQKVNEENCINKTSLVIVLAPWYIKEQRILKELRLNENIIEVKPIEG